MFGRSILSCGLHQKYYHVVVWQMRGGGKMEPHVENVSKVQRCLSQYYFVLFYSFFFSKKGKNLYIKKCITTTNQRWIKKLHSKSKMTSCLVERRTGQEEISVYTNTFNHMHVGQSVCLKYGLRLETEYHQYVCPQYLTKIVKCKLLSRLKGLNDI